MSELELKAKLYQKLWEVFQEVDYVQKDKSVSIREKKAYNYASEAAIKATFHKALVKNRLLFLPYDSQLEPAREVRTLDQYGKERVQVITPVKLFYRFIDIDTGCSYEGAMHGMGGDALDKGLYKDITGAFKYIFHTTFVLPTGDDPEGGEDREQQKEEKKQAKVVGHAAQQAIATRKVAQLEAGTHEPNWDWRIALPRYESYEVRFGKAETAAALQMAGYRSLENTPNAAAAAAALDEVKRTLLAAQNSTRAAATEADEHRAKPESKLEHASAPLENLMKQVLHGSFKTRFDIIQKQKESLFEKYGAREGESRYFAVLDEHGGHIETHANEIAKSGPKSEAVARDLWLELHPEAVEEVNA